MAKKKTENIADSTVENKMRALYELQFIDSEIDKIRTIRGELPLEVQDLEDEIKGLETRIVNFQDTVKELEDKIVDRKNAKKEAEMLKKRYEKQQMNVRNNREYDSLSKEIEYQDLEGQLCEKHIKEFQVQIEDKKVQIAEAGNEKAEKENDLKIKKEELDNIKKETKSEEDKLTKISKSNEKIVEERLLTAYKRIRSSARNGLAVVAVERDACGGCFNKIPPQRQLDIKTRKKIIVCEFCGRILIDSELSDEIKDNLKSLVKE